MAQGCYICCSMLSCFGAVFLALVGMILQQQPEFVHGLDHEKSHSSLYRSCYIGAGMYAGILVAMIGSKCYRARREALVGQPLKNEKFVRPEYDEITTNKSQLEIMVMTPPNGFSNNVHLQVNMNSSSSPTH